MVSPQPQLLGEAEGRRRKCQFLCVDAYDFVGLSDATELRVLNQLKECLVESEEEGVK